ncbi:MAG: vWA domain-containing protein, partial [Myxococcaceae bacterium]
KELDRLEVLSIDQRESELRDRARAVLPAKVGAGLATRALVRKRMLWPLFLLLGLMLSDFWLTARARA